MNSYLNDLPKEKNVFRTNIKLLFFILYILFLETIPKSGNYLSINQAKSPLNIHESIKCIKS